MAIQGAKYTKSFVSEDKELVVILSTDPTPFGFLKHASVSHHSRNPTWEEIQAVREEFFDEPKTVMMLMPPKKYYVNLHKHAFHLWEAHFDWKIM